jgi:hypothetical protein
MTKHSPNKISYKYIGEYEKECIVSKYLTSVLVHEAVAKRLRGEHILESDTCRNVK